jgi:hypothetical protein
VKFEAATRDLLGRALAWEDAHVGFDAAVDGLQPELRGAQPPGLPFSPWQLVEHLRLTQQDILDFCRNPEYGERRWPDEYWPATPEPPTADAWDESLRQYREDRAALQRLAATKGVDLHEPIPHGSGQSILRELLLVADHTAYHVGQLVFVRRLLGTWG